MDHVTYCVMCLATKVKMYRLNTSMLKIYRELILRRYNRRRKHVDACYECAYLLHKFAKFKMKCCKAYNLLRKLRPGSLEVTEEDLKHIDRKQNELESLLTVFTATDYYESKQELYTSDTQINFQTIERESYVNREEQCKGNEFKSHKQFEQLNVVTTTYNNNHQSEMDTELESNIRNTSECNDENDFQHLYTLRAESCNNNSNDKSIIGQTVQTQQQDLDWESIGNVDLLSLSQLDIGFFESLVNYLLTDTIVNDKQGISKTKKQKYLIQNENISHGDERKKQNNEINDFLEFPDFVTDGEKKIIKKNKPGINKNRISTDPAKDEEATEEDFTHRDCKQNKLESLLTVCTSKDYNKFKQIQCSLDTEINFQKIQRESFVNKKEQFNENILQSQDKLEQPVVLTTTDNNNHQSEMYTELQNVSNKPDCDDEGLRYTLGAESCNNNSNEENVIGLTVHIQTQKELDVENITDVELASLSEFDFECFKRINPVTEKNYVTKNEDIINIDVSIRQNNENNVFFKPVEVVTDEEIINKTMKQKIFRSNKNGSSNDRAKTEEVIAEDLKHTNYYEFKQDRCSLDMDIIFPTMEKESLVNKEKRCDENILQSQEKLEQPVVDTTSDNNNYQLEMYTELELNVKNRPECDDGDDYLHTLGTKNYNNNTNKGSVIGLTGQIQTQQDLDLESIGNVDLAPLNGLDFECFENMDKYPVTENIVNDKENLSNKKIQKHVAQNDNIIHTNEDIKKNNENNAVLQCSELIENEDNKTIKKKISVSNKNECSNDPAKNKVTEEDLGHIDSKQNILESSLTVHTSTVYYESKEEHCSSNTQKNVQTIKKEIYVNKEEHCNEDIFQTQEKLEQPLVVTTTDNNDYQLEMIKELEPNVKNTTECDNKDDLCCLYTLRSNIGNNNSNEENVIRLNVQTQQDLDLKSIGKLDLPSVTKLDFECFEGTEKYSVTDNLVNNKQNVSNTKKRKYGTRNKNIHTDESIKENNENNVVFQTPEFITDEDNKPIKKKKSARNKNKSSNDPAKIEEATEEDSKHENCKQNKLEAHSSTDYYESKQERCSLNTEIGFKKIESDSFGNKEQYSENIFHSQEKLEQSIVDISSDNNNYQSDLYAELELNTNNTADCDIEDDNIRVRPESCNNNSNEESGIGLNTQIQGQQPLDLNSISKVDSAPLSKLHVESFENVEKYPITDKIVDNEQNVSNTKKRKYVTKNGNIVHTDESIQQNNKSDSFFKFPEFIAIKRKQSLSDINDSSNDPDKIKEVTGEDSNHIDRKQSKLESLDTVHSSTDCYESKQENCSSDTKINFQKIERESFVNREQPSNDDIFQSQETIEQPIVITASDNNIYQSEMDTEPEPYAKITSDCDVKGDNVSVYTLGTESCNNNSNEENGVGLNIQIKRQQNLDLKSISKVDVAPLSKLRIERFESVAKHPVTDKLVNNKQNIPYTKNQTYVTQTRNIICTDESIKQNKKGDIYLNFPKFITIKRKQSLNNNIESTNNPAKIEKVDRLTLYSKFFGNDMTVVRLTRRDAQFELLLRKETRNYDLSSHKCNLCYQAFMSEATYEAHMKKHSLDYGTIKCNICHLKFSDKPICAVHWEACHTWKFLCKSCPYMCYSIKQAKIHLSSHKCQTYACKDCGESFRCSNSLSTHIRLKHIIEFICDFCGEVFTSAHGRDMHSRQRHRQAKNKQLGPKCDECDVHFASERAWKRHRVLGSRHCVSNGCAVCGEVFPNEAELKAHSCDHGKSTTTTNSQSYKMESKLPCELCNEVLRDTHAYLNHVFTEHPLSEVAMKLKNKFICEECGKGFRDRNSLIRHLKIHADGRPFNCTECGEEFKTEYTLKMHRTIHTYKCHLCPKAFSNQGRLNKHIKMHVNVRPYKCSYCERSFMSRCEERLHTEQVHYKEPYPNKRKKNAAKTDDVEDLYDCINVKTLHSHTK